MIPAIGAVADAAQGPEEPGSPLERALLIAAGVIVLGELWLLCSRPASPWSLLVTAVAVTGFTAALLALALRLGLLMIRRVPAGTWRRSLVGGLFALPLILPVSLLLFQGTGISSRWYAPFGPYLLVPVLYLAAVGGLRLLGLVGGRLGASTRRARWPLALCALVGAALFAWADRTLYPNQYLYLHWVLLLVTLLLLTGAAWLAAPRGGSRWLTPAALLLCAPLFAWTAAVALGSHQQRQSFITRTHAAARLAGAYRALVDFDGDHHSIIFGGRDCDNFNPAVHPFAREIPSNGLDEDCDGLDLVTAPATAPDPGRLDEAGYRQSLARWRREPAWAGMLRRLSDYNVLLVVVDALRADQLVPGEENQQNHPHLMDFLGRNISFTRAFSTGAGTDIGMATIFTGQLDPFARDNHTLLQAYQQAGFVTHGVFQREVEKWVGRQFSLAGLDGRKVVVNDPYRRDLGTHATSKQVTDQGIRFMESHMERKFFLWLHYFDVHEHHQIDPDHMPQPEQYRVARGLPFYRSMIRYVDQQVGRLLESLQSNGLAERTIVLLVSDHGEGLAQSPRLPRNHGDVLFNPLIHVPMCFRVPGLPGRQVPFPVSVADLFPTMMDLSGLERQETFGISLLPFILGGQAPPFPGLNQLEHPLLIYEARQRGIILWPYKLLLWLDQELVELYHLEDDYGEARNLADEQDALVRSLSARLNSYPLITIDRLTKRAKR